MQENPREHEHSLFFLLLYGKGSLSLSSKYDAWNQALTARGTAMAALSTERDSKEHQGAFMKADGDVCDSTLAVIESMLLLMGIFDELKPEHN